VSKLKQNDSATLHFDMERVFNQREKRRVQMESEIKAAKKDLVSGASSNDPNAVSPVSNKKLFGRSKTMGGRPSNTIKPIMIDTGDSVQDTNSKIPGVSKSTIQKNL